MNLVYKVFAILHIAAELCPSSFALKVDEDVVFNIDRFLGGVHKYFFPEKADIYCRVWHGMLPKRNASGKWYISTDQYPGKVYPDFCSGPAYALTRSAARRILNNTHLLPDIQVEDVLITGMIAEKARVNRVPLPEMFHRKNLFARKCDTLPDGTPALLAKHNFKTYGEMREAWKRISRPECPQ
ncbi:hypothetical protein PMAYCL1PPCAC_31329 [Pristionchus mayeri]|uniref:Hexosyltransferase n=1 Tax=Pristionchus mayeri TaxID=1317129 RepID=A0AAN5DG21_9BILA|nr:hypothetical protein PMAYCL1PPCAC_31329 [Pristionchus mayeri]